MHFVDAKGILTKNGGFCGMNIAWLYLLRQQEQMLSVHASF